MNRKVEKRLAWIANILSLLFLIVGGGIANADDPVEAAKQCRDAIEGK